MILILKSNLVGELTNFPIPEILNFDSMKGRGLSLLLEVVPVEVGDSL